MLELQRVVRKLSVRRFGWAAAFVGVLLLSVAVVAYGSAPAAHPGDVEAFAWNARSARLMGRDDAAAIALAHPVRFSVPGAEVFAGITGGDQFYSGDLTVGPDQTIEGDVVVSSGNVRVESDGAIEGDLIVYSGNIEVQEDGEVEGDLTAFSGNVTIGGYVGGDVSAWSGNIVLLESSEVEGDVSALNGSIERAEGSVVEGEVLSGPRFNRRGRPGRPFPFGGGFAWEQRVAPSAVERFWRLVLRLVGAGVITALLAGAAWLLTTVRPHTVEGVKATIQRETALSFVVGIVVNLALVFITGILTITICLAPIAMIPVLTIIALNIAGWTALGSLAVERFGRGTGRNLTPAWSAALGVAGLTAVTTGLWAFGGCFRFVGFVLTLVVASIGAGAFLLPWIRRHGIGGSGFAPVESPAEPAGPSSSGGEATGTAPIDAGATISPEGATASAETVTLSSEETSDVEMTGEVAPAAPAAVDESERHDIQPVDDFTQLRGVGPVTDRRLKEAGILTFAALAQLSVDEVAEIVGFPPERIARIELIEQARAKAGGGASE